MLAKYKSAGNLNISSRKAQKTFVKIPEEKENSLIFAMEIFSDCFEQFMAVCFDDKIEVDSFQLNFVKFCFKMKNGLQIFTYFTDTYVQLSRSVDSKNLEIFCQKIRWFSLKLCTQFTSELEHYCESCYTAETWELETDYSSTRIFASILYSASYLMKTISTFLQFYGKLVLSVLILGFG